MLLQSHILEHLPETHTIHVALFESVTNASFLQEQLLSANTDYEYAFIDASVIVSKVHALAAAWRAVNDFLEGRLKSRNVHSETVFCLSPNNNIAESFRRFGVTPTTASLLVIKVTSPSTPGITAESIQAHLSESIKGTQVPFEDDVLAKMTDLARVRKIYKLNDAGGVKGGKKALANGSSNNGAVREVDMQKELEVWILGAMALRGAG